MFDEKFSFLAITIIPTNTELLYFWGMMQDFENISDQQLIFIETNAFEISKVFECFNAFTTDRSIPNIQRFQGTAAINEFVDLMIIEGQIAV